MDIAELIAERKIAEARAEGAFDDLEGHGRPIPDLDRTRPSGWWIERTIRTERHRLLADAD